MKKLSVSIAKKLIRDKRPPEHPDVRVKYGILEGWLSILVNCLLFIIKITAGIKIQSAALIADAVHTLADSATSIVIIIGFKISQKPSDAEHPFGHGRIEPIATLIISILLFVAGFELLHHSIRNIMTPSNTKAGYMIILIILGTVIIKELLARFSFAIGDYINSDALKADALHHRSDVFATLLVVVALIASRFGYYNVDGVMGCFVSLIIFYSAFLIAKDAISPLLGEAPSPEFLKQIEDLCLSITGVLGVHDIISHQYGQNRITSLHIEVCHKQNAFELHMIAEQIEDDIGVTTNGIAVVNIDPVNRNHPGYEAVSGIITSAIKKDDRINLFYDLKIIGENIENASILFNIETTDAIPETENNAVITELSDNIKASLPGIRIRIKANPRFSYNV